jgi:hypothetical protein
LYPTVALSLGPYIPAASPQEFAAVAWPKK